MYADAGLLLPVSQGPPQPLAAARHPWPPPGEELLCGFHTDLLGGGYHMMASVSEYYMGDEGDLFKAPEPIIEEPVLEFDPMSAVISMISVGEDIITSGTMKTTDMELLQNEHLLYEVFYECEKDLIAKSVIAESSPLVGDLTTPIVPTEENLVMEQNNLVPEVPLQKSVSSGCLNSEWLKGCTMRPDLLNFQRSDVGTVFGLRRSYSEGDIQILGSGNFIHGSTSIVHPSLAIGDLKIEEKTEERRRKLSRYRKKKTQRNFGRKIKYACRKALADSQPRIRGRFAKTEECEGAKPPK